MDNQTLTTDNSSILQNRIDFIKNNLIIHLSQFSFATRCQYAICNRIQDTYPLDAIVDTIELNKLKNNDKVYINILIPNIIEAIDSLYNFLNQKLNEDNTPLQLYFLIMGEPIIPDWIVNKLYPFTIRMFLQNNTYNDPKIGFMPIGIRDGEEVFKENQYFSSQFLIDEVNTIRKKEFFCLLCFSNTHPERVICENVLGNRRFIFNLNKAGFNGQPSKYCGNVPILINYEYTHKSLFVLCPTGVGQATHRFFEAIALHSIPIVKKTNTPFDAIYDFFPCFVVVKWEDITSQILQNNLHYLTQKMNEFHDLYPEFLTYPYDFCI